MNSYALKLYRRWRLVRILRRLQAALAERDPRIRRYTVPQFYRLVLRTYRRLKRVAATTGVTSTQAARSFIQMGRAIRNAERNGMNVEHLKGGLGR